MKYENSPKEQGYYWLKNSLSNKPTRMVKVWRGFLGGQLFVDEDRDAPVDDNIYKNHVWLGPLIEPHFI